MSTVESLLEQEDVGFEDVGSRDAGSGDAGSGDAGFEDSGSGDVAGTAVEGPGQDDGTNVANDFVTFEMAGESYALPMERVQEIIRMPELIRVPLGPAALEGLANLRGRVLPVVSLRTCCGLAGTEHDEATRVVVVEAAGATLGLVVDRVTAVVSVEPDQLESAEGVQSTVRSELLAAVLKGTAGKGAAGRMTTVLDVQHLVRTEFADLARKVAGTGGAGWSPTAAVVEEEDSSGTLELVSFAVDGQEYALPIDRVQEIVQAPERVTAVPNAAARVLGVMDLRGGLLPVVSLRQVFGLEVPALQAHNRIVVVTVEREGRESLVGVVMDTVREVLRVPADLVGALPHVVSGGGRSREVQSVCRLEDGKRLVSVLSADSLVDVGALADLDPEDVAVSRARDEQEDDVSDDGRGDDELLVVFRLQGEEYCVAVDAVQEIVRVPETLIRVPKTLDFVEGLVNLRGAVLPVVDLRTRLGLDRSARDERQRIVVLIIGGVRTGFVVDSVAEVLRVSGAELEDAPELSPEQAEVVTRVANLPRQQRMLLVLDPSQLLGRAQVAQLAEEVPAAASAA
ncbi:chemotaxis protein CheW [Kineococcus radiotolerans]|uniref:Chemotaxis protein CheW n=1 Tax=Kineococcus radiotolerans (strain ATCC BAA-149 / DSM 14245 / SRS30216) TaxID=266940 RepID=A6W943_KINRD|nr:chemotaxis protein CheW [Kineococcus radiotolerans]ABS03332.1 putative CheW protein [Kineococcus radiotolerans SRS30216 = ATCC BAA-149]